jgi:GTP-binding protein Era
MSVKPTKTIAKRAKWRNAPQLEQQSSKPGKLPSLTNDRRARDGRSPKQPNSARPPVSAHGESGEPANPNPGSADAAAPYRTGTVSIAGRPNAGKSTLANALVGEKVAIVAPQAQTTRTSLRGIANFPLAQIVFTDTPGIHKSDSPLNRRMMDAVRGSLEGQDLILFVADATREPVIEDEQAISALRKTAPSILVLSKIDRLADKRQLLPLIAAYAKLYPFDEVFPVSAKTGQGLKDLIDAIVRRLPEGPPVFPADQYTDQPARFLVAEFIRERVLLATRQEVPHSVAVLIDQWQEEERLRSPKAGHRLPAQHAGSLEDGTRLIRIAATILVERPGQKKILIGRQGGLLKQIGTEARLEVEKLVGGPVFLSLFVKVQPKWREDPQFLRAIDWRS